MLRVTHLIDDNAMGGVMTALRNFDDPRLQSIAASDVHLINPKKICTRKFTADLLIVHFTVSWAKLIGLFSLRLVNPHARIIVIEHTYTRGFEQWNVRHRRRFHFMLKIAYRMCDHVIGVSEGQTEWLEEICVAPNLNAIAQSRSLKDFVRPKPGAPVTDQPLKFGAIGRFHAQKGFDSLIRAFLDAETNGSTLTLAGYGEQEEHLKNLAAEEPSITFVGKVNDPASFYQQVDVVIIPSRWEAYGLVATEAMAAGKLVVASDVDGLPEQVSNVGVVCCAADLSKIISKIAAQPQSEIRAAGISAQHAASSRYDTMIAHWRRYLEAFIQPA